MLENKVSHIVDRLREASKTKTIVLLDYNTNADVDNPRKPLSHASLIKAYVEGRYPYGDMTPTKENSHVELSLFQ